MAVPETDVVRAALRRVWPEPAAVAAADIRALEGGLNRRSYLVTAGGRRCVLRVPAPGAAGLLGLEAEAEVMRAAAAAGLAPVVVGIDAPEGLILTEYREAAPWTPEAARRPANIARVATLLRKLHRVVAPVPVFRAEHFASAYLTALALQPVERAWADELTRLARWFDASYSPMVLCHNDLVATNVLDAGASLWLVDFEYAVRSAPLLDLASVAGMNDYTHAQCSELSAAYHQHGPAALPATDLTDAVRMVRLLAFFWARVGEQCETPNSVYGNLAAQLRAALK